MAAGIITPYVFKMVFWRDVPEEKGTQQEVQALTVIKESHSNNV